jgi:hypothetical protein
MRPATGGWRAIPIRDVRVRQGAVYWIAVMAHGASLVYREQHRTDCRREMTIRVGIPKMPPNGGAWQRKNGCSESAYASRRPVLGRVVGSPIFPVAIGSAPAAGGTSRGGGSGAGGSGGSGSGGSGGTVGGTVSPPPGGCFPAPGACGLPDPTYGNVGATSPCSSLPVSSPTTVSTPGTTIANRQINGRITVTAANVTIQNVCVIENGGASSGSQAIVLQSGATNVTIQRVTVAGANASNQSIDQAITNNSGTTATVSGTYVYNCGECIWGSGFVLQRSYVISNGMQGTSDHMEALYCSDGTETLDQDVLLNPQDQTAALFCDTHYGQGGGCDNHITITNSLLAGGGYTLYPCGNASSVGTSSMNISSNRFARCTTPPINYNPGTGGNACQGSTGTTIGSGADAHGYWPHGGYFGTNTSTYCTGSGQVWSGNVWDDNGASLGC